MANQLTATLSGGQVVVSGDKNRVKLPKDSGSRTFDFKLDDRTEMNVRFSSLSADESDSCPPRSGINTDQIVNVGIGDKRASFTDLNSGDARTICYAWHFACDDPGQRPEFDPIVDNGGGNA
jgi:hypothetical protein